MPGRSLPWWEHDLCVAFFTEVNFLRHRAQRRLSLNFGFVYSKQGLVRHVLLPRPPATRPPHPERPACFSAANAAAPVSAAPASRPDF